MRPSRLLLALLITACPVAARQPLLSAPFDGDDNALLRGETIIPFATHTGPYVVGLRGQARILGGMNRLSYFVDEGFFPPQGALSMWVQPRDWAPDAPHFVFFASFTMTDTDNKYVRLILYKMYNGSDLTMLMQDTREENRSARIQTPMTGWEPGQWHHLALSWDQNGCELFVDGESAGTCSRIPLPAAGRWEIAVGTPYQGWAYLGREKSAIDEFTGYSTPLTADEVKQQYEATLAAAPPEAFELPDTTGGMPPIEGNLALAKLGAFALASSFADYEAHYPDNLVDDNDTTVWAPFDAAPPLWLEVRWPWPVRASEVILRRTGASGPPATGE
ncbi:MAG: LamG domain-containing protein, partial [Armatimonadetes bacterium]|nr:LamG domain-containing protein [Armatimonadota bacterium]